jgi:hypothetical protein
MSVEILLPSRQNAEVSIQAKPAPHTLGGLIVARIEAEIDAWIAGVLAGSSDDKCKKNSI